MSASFGWLLLEFLLSYKDGLLASVQGFLVLHKLDSASQEQTPVRDVQRAVSVEPTPARMTVLEKRRLQQRAERKASTTPPPVMKTRTKASHRVMQCVALHVGSIILLKLLAVIITFCYPDIHKYDKLATAAVCCVTPLFLLLRAFSTLWFADVANAAYRYRGFIQNSKPAEGMGLSNFVADFLHAVLLDLIFQAHATFVLYLPVQPLAVALKFTFLCLLHSLYCFEYAWMSRGLGINTRVSLVERNWPYHMGFGTILTALSMATNNFIINGCLFGAFFPFFIVSSFLTTHPDSKNSNLPAIPFFAISQLLTNVISQRASGRIKINPTSKS